MLSLPSIAPGARVAVLAPSSPIRPEMLAEGLEELRRLGFRPVVEEGIAGRHRFSAGPDAARAAALQAALDSAEIEAIWLARGGYGLSPLLSRLDPRGLIDRPKTILGESDATALGCFALTAGLPWIHGPMVAGALRLGEEGYDRESLLSALAAGAGRPEPLRAGRCLSPGRAVGRAWGGCLSLLAGLCGTPWLREPPGEILIIEDIGVKPYQVHRMLVQLRDAGLLAGLSGVVLGDFSDCRQHAEQGYDMDDVLLEFFESVNEELPLSIDWPLGHARAPHLSVVLGRRVELLVPARGEATLSYLD